MRSGSGDEEEKRFRVSVCLERFFGDERARCFVSVSAGRRVRWLRRRLRRLFALRGRLALLTKDHLLPPDEPLALLRPDDVVHVIPASRYMENSESSDLETLTVSENIEPTEISNVVLETNHAARKRKRNNSKQQQNSCDNITLHLNQENIDTTYNVAIPPAGNLVTENQWATNEHSVSDPLNDVKERALALLDSCVAAPEARRRRRVRRRRPRVPLPAVEFTAESFAVAAEAIAVTDEPVAVADEPVAFADEPVAFADEPVAFADEPVAFADEPVAFADEPVAFADEPIAFADEPVAVAAEPVAAPVDEPAAESPTALIAQSSAIAEAQSVTTSSNNEIPEEDEMQNADECLARPPLTFFRTVSTSILETSAAPECPAFLTREAPPATEIVRNGSSSPRVARLVRPLVVSNVTIA